MDFSYSEEQQDVRALAQKILGDQTQPERLGEIDKLEDRFDEKLWQDLADAGLLGVAIDERYGGMGFGFETLCLLIEEAGRTVAPLPLLSALVTTAATLQQFANDAMCNTYLPALASGSALISSALIEPGNENTSTPATRAEETAEGWRLTGVKHCVPFANRASRVLLSARTAEGLMVLLADPGAPGVTLNRQRTTASEPQFEMVLDGVTSNEVVAAGDDAEQLVKWMTQATTAAYAAMATGLCDKMMRMTASYTSERHQFGVPVATFQAVGHRAADCFIDIECLRLVSQQAISLIDQGVDADEATKIAKIWTGDVTHRVSQASQHLHGGIGVDRDYPLFRFCLWARQIELSAGSSAELLGRLGKDIAARFAVTPG